MSKSQRISGTIATFEHRGRMARFFVQNEQDIIQKRHYAGNFYELEELELISSAFRPGGSFLDVGSNVGNHAIYAVYYMAATKVVVIEPNPAAIEILRVNLALNSVGHAVDTRLLGVGLSDASGSASLTSQDNNLGGTRLSLDDGAAVRVVRGDDVLDGATFDFIKIDVEGFEMRVLRGLEGTIRVCRPNLFVEVDAKNQSLFNAWADEHRYQIIGSYRRYPWSENLLLEPRSS